MISKAVDSVIEDAIKKYDGSYAHATTFEKLISMGELIDRLSIVNFKLYTLKNKVMQSKDDKFKSWAAEEDVKLVRERARLKACIDEKLGAMIHRFKLTGQTGFNKEVKDYEVKHFVVNL